MPMQKILQLENHSKAAHRRNLKLVCSSDSPGLPALVNEGVHIADGEIIALLNDSMTANHPDWLEKKGRTRFTEKRRCRGGLDPQGRTACFSVLA
ncbi:MAG: hypothetical protein CM1200mP20_05240 [Pseudomonadota bacterium]|nr:MAG: hypothetical protein CM1200mP20_05240 [Pseudomonadota bacterium]